VQAHTGLPLAHDDRLKERAFGAFEGQFRKDILERHGRSFHENYHDLLPPDSESADALMTRIGHVVGDYLQSHSHHKLLFVGHGAFMAHLCGLVGLDSAKRFENATPYHFRPAGEAWVLERVEAE
jgi:broad specificity phosphatase PhoE